MCFRHHVKVVLRRLCYFMTEPAKYTAFDVVPNVAGLARVPEFTVTTPVSSWLHAGLIAWTVKGHRFMLPPLLLFPCKTK